MDLSVLVPYHDNARTLPRLLDSLAAQRGLEEVRWEIVLVDNGSSDRGPQLVAEFAARSGVTCRSIGASERFGPGYARNAGVRAARGEWIVPVDADDWLAPDFLASIYAVRKAGTVVKGSVLTADCGTGRVLGRGPGSGARIAGERFPHITLPACLYPRELLVALPWNEALLAGEDYELHIRSLLHGYDLALADTDWYHHTRVNALWPLLERGRRYARYDVEIEHIYREVMGDEPRPVSQAWLVLRKMRQFLRALKVHGRKALRLRHWEPAIWIGKGLTMHAAASDPETFEETERVRRLLVERGIRNIDPTTWPRIASGLPPATQFLTFDDGPTPETTPAVLAHLGAHGQRATFFVVGRRARAHPDLIRRILDEGHEIGNHSLGHFWLTDLQLPDLRREIVETNEILGEIVGGGFRPRWFRAPYGQMTAIAKLIVNAERMSWVKWTHDTFDWHRDATPASIAEVVNRQTRPSIFDLHDGTEPHPTYVHAEASSERSATVAALPLILEHAARNGTRFLTLSEGLGSEPQRGREGG